jgi:HAD superfamily hydrolase (TIGR01490 family)
MESSTNGVVFFDMDQTLVAGNSTRLYASRLWKEGRISLFQIVRVAVVFFLYRFGLIDMTRVTQRVVAGMRGMDEATLQEECRRLFDVAIDQRVYPEALLDVNRHLAAGDRVVVLSATSPYLVAPFVERYGLDGMLCSEAEVVDGKFTGKAILPVCYGPGKLVWAQRYCDEHGFDLTRSTFYTDSCTDLPVLEVVQHPIVVNPDPRLARIARQRNWPVRVYRPPADAVDPETLR